MNVFVMIKEVPDMAKVKFDREKGTVNRNSAEGEINPFDLNALQAAVDLKETLDCQVIAVTMGPPKAEKSLRDAFARGADQCLLATDAKFGGSDTLATSRTLAAAMKKAGSADLILCGEKSVDGDTAQVGAEVAELMGIPHCYYVEEIQKVTEKEVYVTIEDLSGKKQERVLQLPALLSVTKNINAPKLPSLKRKLASLEVQINTVKLEQMEGILEEKETGFKGSPTKVLKIEVPKVKARDSKLFREDYEAFSQAIRPAVQGQL